MLTPFTFIVQTPSSTPIVQAGQDPIRFDQNQIRNKEPRGLSGQQFHRDTILRFIVPCEIADDLTLVSSPITIETFGIVVWFFAVSLDVMLTQGFYVQTRNTAMGKPPRVMRLAAFTKNVPGPLRSTWMDSCSTSRSCLMMSLEKQSPRNKSVSTESTVNRSVRPRRARLSAGFLTTLRYSGRLRG